MSTFYTKISQGRVPSLKDWDEHLLEAHNIAPGMTPRAFAAFKTKEGRTSYEILAEQLGHDGRDVTIVDLACGDGFLAQFLLPRLGPRGKYVGIDMFEAELHVARKKVTDPRASFHRSRAQELPFSPQSVDYIFCHMALMLMAPLEPVALEISRALKKGGRLAAIYPNPNAKPGVYADIRKPVSEFLARRYPAIKEATAGDKRIYDFDELGAIFSPHLGFKNVESLGEIELLAEIEPEKVWDHIRDMYFISMLPADEKKHLRKEIGKSALREVGNSGTLRFEIPLRGFAVSKQS